MVRHLPAIRSSMLAAALLCTGVAPAHAAATPAEAQKEFASIYGDRERRIISDHSPKEYARFAGTLLDAVKQLSDDPALSALMLQKAYDYGLKDPDGYDTAVTAAQELIKLEPDRKADYQAKLTEVHHLEFQHGTTPQQREAGGKAWLGALVDQADALAAEHRGPEAIKVYAQAMAVNRDTRSARQEEISGKIRDVRHDMDVTDRIAKLSAAAQASSDEAKTKALNQEIEMLYLADLNDPARAADFAGKAGDFDTQRMAKLATKPKADLTEDDLLKLGGWYMSLVVHARQSSRLDLLTRAETYYTQFLTTHDKQDAAHLEATTALQRIEKQLDLVGNVYTADRIVVWNQHNSHNKDRGTTEFNLILMLHGEPVWSRQNIPLAWLPDKDPSVTIPLPRKRFDKVRIEISAWTGWGGGLSEIEVWRGTQDIARGAKVEVSGTYNSDYHASSLVDGVTTSDTFAKGYWVLPDKKPGWVEVSIPLAR